MTVTGREGASLNDFYLDEYSAAAYFEKDWFDEVIRTGSARPGRFAFAPFDLGQLYSPFQERLANLIRAVIDPRSLLEIGSSTGRLFYELAKGDRRLEHATLVEPSRNLRLIHDRIFDGPPGHSYFRVPKGLGEWVEVRMDVTPMRMLRRRVDVRSIDLPFAEVPSDLGQFDLVACANVVDQCHEPLRLVDLLKRSCRPGGVVAVACTYQWQPKYRGLPAPPITHLDEVFREPWLRLSETNIPFRVRVNERHWMTFLSHVVLYRSAS